MKRKLLLTFLTIVIVSLAIPAAAFAADLTIDDTYLLTNPSTYDLGSHTAGDVITISTSQPVTLTSSASPLIGVRIICTGGVNLTVDSLFVNMLSYNQSPLTFQGTGNTVTAVGHNIFLSDDTQPGIRIEAGTQVTFDGNNTTSSIAGYATNTTNTPGSGNAAGIGGGTGNAMGTIIINGSLVQGYATGSGAGIGGGNGASGGSITINDGRAEGYNFGGGAGIGGGSSASGGNIVINDGVVIAEATGGGAGIGGGYNAEGGSITINDGYVYSISNNSGAGIGGGNSSTVNGSGNSGTIMIAGGTVYGESSSGAGIGSGYLAQTNTGSITITGGNVEGVALNEGAGIGGGSFSSAGTITITGGTVFASSVNGRGLGSGDNWGGGSLRIAGNSLVFASGNSSLADIGSAFSSLTIGGNSEVYTAHGIIDVSLVTTHTYEPGTLISAGGNLVGVGSAYSFTSPSGWEASATGGYFVSRLGEPAINTPEPVINPQTGDSSNYRFIYIISAVLMIIAAAVVIVKKRATIQ